MLSASNETMETLKLMLTRESLREARERERKDYKTFKNNINVAWSPLHLLVFVYK
jgi:hypothetical protein